MRNLIVTLILLLITTPTFALNPGNAVIKVTVNKPPEKVKLKEPADGDVIAEGNKIRISASAEDPNKDVLKYRFKITNTTRDGWSDWSTQSWIDYKPGKDDIGLNEIKAEVKDDMETVPTGKAQIYVVRLSPDLPMVQ